MQTVSTLIYYLSLNPVMLWRGFDCCDESSWVSRGPASSVIPRRRKQFELQPANDF